VYDVDDPSSTNAPLDDETAFTDNKGAHTPPSTTPFSTDTNGIADAMMTLSMQPGDNFRAVAATDANFFNGVAARQNDGLNASVTNGSGAIPGNQITTLLTIWRRLHVEVDSMSAVVSNYVTGNVTAISGSATAATNLVLSVNLRTGLALPDNSLNLSSGTNRGRFENGWIRFGTNMAQSVVEGNGDDFVRSPAGFSIPAEIVSGASTINAGQVIGMSGSAFNITANLGTTSYAGAILRVAGTGFTIAANTPSNITVNGSAQIPFYLHDDDDDSILPRNPDTSDLARAFQPAYVAVLFDLPNPTPVAPFVPNFPNDATATLRAAFQFDNVATEAAPSFWTVYVISAYQLETHSDNDPVPSPPPLPSEGATFGSVDDFNAQGALIFLECLREYPPTPTVSEAFTVSHEVGHLFDGRHPDGGLMAQSSIRTNINFTPVTLNRIRTIPHP